jgi:hypothetical protein
MVGQVMNSSRMGTKYIFWVFGYDDPQIKWAGHRKPSIRNNNKVTTK